MPPKRNLVLTLFINQNVENDWFVQLEVGKLCLSYLLSVISEKNVCVLFIFW